MQALSDRELVRRVARDHVELTAAEDLGELDEVFDVVYDAVLERMQHAEEMNAGPGQLDGLPFDSFVEGTLVASVIWTAASLVQLALAKARRPAPEQLAAELPQLRGQKGGEELIDAIARRVVNELSADAQGADELLFHDADLRIGAAQNGGHSVHLQSPAGEARGVFHCPDSLCGLDSLPQALGRMDQGRDLRPVDRLQAIGPNLYELGEQLYDALITGRIRERFHHLLGTIGRRDREVLRIRLHLEPDLPELTSLSRIPWELLRRPDTRDLLALNRRYTLLRSLDIPVPSSPLPLRLPLRILLVIASPRGVDRLDVEKEGQQILKVWRGDDRVEIVTLERATLSALRQALLQQEIHVLHFIGHGTFDADQGRGALVLEHEDGSTVQVAAEKLATVLQDRTSLRLAVINACHSARAGEAIDHDPFAGVAAALTLSGLPAVVAMQQPISDTAAIIFSSTLYQRLAEGDPIDTAVTEARMAIFTADSGSFEWITPVLFMRCRDGRFFAPRKAPLASCS